MEGIHGIFMEQEHDGLVFTGYREGILVTGGLSMRMLWRFNFRTLEWSQLRTQGQFAPCGRIHHTVGVWGDSLIVCGGITLDPEDELAVYRLDMISMRWSRMQTCCPEPDLPNTPLGRSHHAATVSGDTFFVYGGKPNQGDLTTADYRMLHLQGYFDVLMLHLPTGGWTRRAHSLPGEYVPSPPLWGHTMSVMDGGALLLFGGFEIDLGLEGGEESYTSREEFDKRLGENVRNDTPGAELRNVICVFSLVTWRWSVFAPNVMTVGPRPRAFHTTQVIAGKELLVIGGIAPAETTGDLCPASDAWAWSAETGSWRRLDPFPIPPYDASDPHRFRGARVMSAIYNDQLVISNDVTTWYVMDVKDPVEYAVIDTGEAEYFHCACVSLDEWQVVSTPAPQAQDNPFSQEGLGELSSTVHSRRSVVPVHHAMPQRNMTVPPVVARPSLPILRDEEREEAMRKFLPFAYGRGSSYDRQGQVNPIIAALVAEGAM